MEKLSAKALSAEIENRSKKWLFNPIQKMNLKLEVIQNTKILAIPSLLTERVSLLLLFSPLLYFTVSNAFCVSCSHLLPDEIF